MLKDVPESSVDDIKLSYVCCSLSISILDTKRTKSSVDK
jgi:hypothetical protein